MSARRAHDRRRVSRHPVEYEVKLQTNAAETERANACFSRDISANGMQLRSDQHYPVSARILLTIECCERGWHHVSSCVGSVVWVTPIPGVGQYLLGVRFDEGEGPLMVCSWKWGRLGMHDPTREPFHWPFPPPLP